MTQKPPADETLPLPNLYLPETPVAKTRGSRIRIVIAAFILVAATAALVLKIHNERTRLALEGPPKIVMSDDQLRQFSLDTDTLLRAAYHGESTDANQRALVARVGAALVASSKNTNYHFHLLAEPHGIDMFALPDGNVYVTVGLLNRIKTEGQLAALLAQGVAHVMGRDVLAGAEAQTKAPAQSSSTPPVLHYTTKEELTADGRALKLMADTGYDPNAMIGLFQLLTDAAKEGAPVAFFSTHPNTADRMQLIQDTITRMYPTGVPATMSK